MKEEAKTANTELSNFHVRDCYVWAEIYYLDSPTDYREYLPTKSPGLNPSRSTRADDIVFLDSNQESGGPGLFAFVIMVLICFSAAGYLLYLLVESF